LFVVHLTRKHRSCSASARPSFALLLALAACGRVDFAEVPDAPPAPPRLTETHYEVGGMEVPDGLYDDTLGTVQLYIHNGDPDGCTMWSAADAYELGEEIAIEDLAPGTLETVPGTRLDTVNFVSTDGIRQLAHFVDHDLGIDCDVSVAKDGYQCAPFRDIAFASYSTTASCTDHVAVDDVPPSAIQWHDSNPGCPLTDFYYYSVSGPITPAQLYQGSACTAVLTLPDGPFYASGPLLNVQPMTELPDDVPGQRVVRTRITGGGAARPFLLYDTQLDVHCHPETMSDGSVRCMPDGAFTSGLYVDPACTDLQTFGWYLDFTNCPQTDFKYVIGGTVSSCSSASSREVYEIGPRYMGQYWVPDQMGNCTGPYSAASPEPRYWTLGRKLDPSELVEATLPSDGR
jgi:hypothetical protein